MSEQTQTYEGMSDDLFAQYSQAMKKEAEDRANKPAAGNFSKDYENVQYVGLEVKQFRTFRFVGAPPPLSSSIDYVRKPWDAKYIGFAEVKDDEGKRMQIRLPLKGDVAAKDHILYRLVNKVNEVEWVKVEGKEKKEKKYKHKDKYPELFEWVNKCGFTEKDGQSYTYAKGLNAQIMALFNVIDRNDDWCEKNKHTKILSKSVSYNEAGEIIFPTVGIPAFGFCMSMKDGLAPLERLLTSKSGGNYESYDIAIMRTGSTDPVYILKNASYYKKLEALTEVENDDGSEFNWETVKIGPLTKEELSYTRYDLDKFYGPTTYQKIMKRLSSGFKLCDACLGTKFYDELEGLVEKEKAEFKEKFGDAKEEAPAKEEKKEAIKEDIPEATVKAPARRAAPAKTGLSEDKIAKLKGWAVLSDAERAQIKDVVDGKPVYTDDAKSTLPCDNDIDGKECGVEVPSDFGHCVACGCEYQVN